MTKRAHIPLSCTHAPLFTMPYPKRGDTVWCERCRGYQDVAGESQKMDEYGYRCRDCKSARTTGKARLQAELQGARHSRSHITHTVEVIYGDEVLRTFAGLDLQATIEVEGLPPF